MLNIATVILSFSSSSIILFLSVDFAFILSRPHACHWRSADPLSETRQGREQQLQKAMMRCRY